MEHEQLGRLGHSETGSGETDGRVLTKKKVTKPKKPKVAPAHPPVATMVDAITALKDRKGSSLAAIKKYISANNKNADAAKRAPFIKRYLKSAVVAGKLVQTKGTGAAGSFKLGKVEKPTKVTKPKAKKPKTPKKAVKKSPTKALKSPKKATKSPKKAKKPAAAAKKPKTPKKAAKPVKKPAKSPKKVKATKPKAKKAAKK